MRKIEGSDASQWSTNRGAATPPQILFLVVVGVGVGGEGGNASPIFQCTPLSLPHFTILPYVSHVPLEKIVYNMTLLKFWHGYSFIFFSILCFIHCLVASAPDTIFSVEESSLFNNSGY